MSTKKYDINRFIVQIQSPKTIALADKVRHLEREGKKIIKFQTGDPDFTTHENIVRALQESIIKGETHYTNSQGLPELREAISTQINNLYGISIKPEKQIIITSGGAQAIFLSLMVLLNPLDEVILLEPYYPQYAYIVQLLGGVVRSIPAILNRDTYTIDYESLKKSINKKTKALIINSPNNPSGKVFTQEEIKTIIKLINKSNIFIISDEVYFQIVDETKKHVSLLEFRQIADRVIYINSFSKTYAMTGWRLGYAIAPDRILEKILKVLQLNITCVPLFIQKAGVVALESKEVQEYTKFMRDRYNLRRKTIYNLINNSFFFKVYPDGAFYYLLQLPNFSSQKVDRWANELLEKELVAVVPAYVYGNSFKNFFRVSFSIEDNLVVEGIGRIINFFNQEMKL